MSSPFVYAHKERIPVHVLTATLHSDPEIYRPLCGALIQQGMEPIVSLWGDGMTFTQKTDQTTADVERAIEAAPYAPRVLLGASGSSIVMMEVANRLEQRGGQYAQALLGVIAIDPSPYRGTALEDLKSHLSLWSTDYAGFTPEEQADLEGRPIPVISKPLMLFLGMNSMVLLHQQAGAIRTLMPNNTVQHLVPEMAHQMDHPKLIEKVANHAAELMLIGMGVSSIWDENFKYDIDLNNLQWGSRESYPELEFARTQNGWMAFRSIDNPTTLLHLDPMTFWCFIQSVKAGNFESSS